MLEIWIQSYKSDKFVNIPLSLIHSENKRGKQDPSKDKQPAVTWKMFIIMFVFYFLWGFKGVIWRYFFPSKKWSFVYKFVVDTKKHATWTEDTTAFLSLEFRMCHILTSLSVSPTRQSVCLPFIWSVNTISEGIVAFAGLISSHRWVTFILLKLIRCLPKGLSKT